MSSSPRYRALTLGLLVALGLLRCSMAPLGGDSTPADDFPNALRCVVKDVNNKAVAGAAVYIRTSGYLSDTSIISGRLPQPEARTDGGGAFSVGSLADGAYVIEISTDSIGLSIACTLSARQKRVLTLPEATLEPFGSIRGAVKFTGAKTAYARTYGLQRAARVDPLTGEYLITRVPQGTFALQVLSPTPAVPSVDIPDISVVPNFPTMAPPVTLQTFDQEDYAQWPYSRTIHLVTTPAGADVADTVVDFPVLVRLNQAAIAFSQAAFDGHDLRFAKQNGAHLHFEIERWDAANRTAAVWVRADTVYGDDTTTIVMYWGKKNAAAFSDGSQVFPPADGYMGVWHMAGAADASGQGHTLATASAATTPASDSGLIGGVMRFDGAGDFWSVPHSPNLDGSDNFSVSVWAQWLGTQVPGYNRIVSNKQAWNDSAGFELLTLSGNDSAIDVRAQDSIGNGPLDVISGWKAHGWHYLTVVWNSGRCSIFVDGALVKTPFISAYDTERDLVFGSNVGNTEQKWNGCLDEIRLTRGPLSAGWVRLCYMNQKPVDALCKY